MQRSPAASRTRMCCVCDDRCVTDASARRKKSDGLMQTCFTMRQEAGRRPPSLRQLGSQRSVNHSTLTALSAGPCDRGNLCRQTTKRTGRAAGGTVYGAFASRAGSSAPRSAPARPWACSGVGRSVSAGRDRRRPERWRPAAHHQHADGRGTDLGAEQLRGRVHFGREQAVGLAAFIWLRGKD